MMLKYCLTFFMVCLIAALGYGQDVIKGRVFERNTRLVLSGIRVQVLETKQLAITDDDGRFAITAKLGDKLIFAGLAYLTDTVVITRYEMEVLLTSKENMLGVVTVNSNNMGAPNAFKPAPDPLYLSKNLSYQQNGGLSLTIPDWNKDQKKKEREEKMIDDNQTMDKIAAVFTATTVAKYIPLKGTVLDDFVALYRPDVKVFTAKDFNMANYINDCYIKFMKLPPDQRHLEKLNGGDQ